MDLDFSVGKKLGIKKTSMIMVRKNAIFTISAAWISFIGETKSQICRPTKSTRPGQILQIWHRQHAQGDPAALQIAPPREDFHNVAFGQLPRPAEDWHGLGIPEWIVLNKIGCFWKW